MKRSAPNGLDSVVTEAREVSRTEIIITGMIDLPHSRDITAPTFNDLKRELLGAIHHPTE